MSQIIIKGTVHIVPNIGSVSPVVVGMQNMHIKNCGLPLEFQLDQYDVPVHVIVTSDTSEDWSTHGVQHPINGTFIVFPRMVPARLLKDLKEGSTWSFSSKDGKIRYELKCLQTKARHPMPGERDDLSMPFNKVLETVIGLSRR